MFANKKQKSIFILMIFFSTYFDFSLNCLTVDQFNTKYGQELKNQNVLSLLKPENIMGKGGMGLVYKIPWASPKNENPTNTKSSIFYANNKKKEIQDYVAIKTSIKKEAIAGLKKELNFYKLFQSLNVKHVPQYYDCLVTDTLQLYIVIENIPQSFETSKGKYSLTLPNFYKEFLEFPPEKRLEIYRQIAEGLVELNNIGISHHDIKPGNLAFDPSQKSGLKILDFGLAQKANEMSSSGTPRYMDLEKRQLTDKLTPLSIKKLILESVDHWKADIWSLGITIYELENNADGNAFEFIRNFTTDLLKNFEMMRNIVLNESWFAKRNINLCSKNTGVCFYDVIEKMMKVQRKDRVITAEKIVTSLADILSNPVDKANAQKSAFGGFLDFITCGFTKKNRRILII